LKLREQSWSFGPNFEIAATIRKLPQKFQNCTHNPRIVDATLKLQLQFWNWGSNFAIADQIRGLLQQF